MGIIIGGRVIFDNITVAFLFFLFVYAKNGDITFSFIVSEEGEREVCLLFFFSDPCHSFSSQLLFKKK